MKATGHRSKNSPASRSARTRESEHPDAGVRPEAPHVEPRLKLAEDRLAAVERLGMLGTWEWSAETGDLWCSEHVYSILGLPPDPGAASLDRLRQLAHPDDLVSLEQAFREGFSHDQVVEIEHRVIRPDGELRVLRESAEIVHDAAGRPAGMRGILQDATAISQSQDTMRARQELLSNLIHLLPVGLWLLNEAGQIQSTNAAGMKVWGGIKYVGVAELGEYKGWWPGTGQQLVPHEWCAARAILHGETVLDQIVEIESFDGKRKTISNSAAPLRAPDGRIQGAIVAVTDISDRVRVEKALHYSNQLLESSREELRRATARFEQRVEEERTQTARDLHEQLGQSLIALKMGLTSLAHVRRDDEQVRSATATMVALVDDTIASTRRISLGLRPFVLDHLGLSAAIESLLQEWSGTTGVKHAFHSSPELITMDRAGSIAVYRLVQEALNNIARHAGASRVQVDMELENGNLRLEIADNGKGIDPEKILAPDSLGLVGMRERAAHLGGELMIEGSHPRGTRVLARIPCAPAPSAKPLS